MILIVGWIVFSIVAGLIAHDRGRSGFGFFVLSMVLSPIIGIILALALGKNAEVIEAKAIESGELRKCPHCAETIKAAATTCRYCGKTVEPSVIPITGQFDAGDSSSKWPPWAAPLVVALAALIFLVIVASNASNG